VADGVNQTLCSVGAQFGKSSDVFLFLRLQCPTGKLIRTPDTKAAIHNASESPPATLAANTVGTSLSHDAMLRYANAWNTPMLIPAPANAIDRKIPVVKACTYR